MLMQEEGKPIMMVFYGFVFGDFIVGFLVVLHSKLPPVD